jgi:hypothetical protein
MSAGAGLVVRCDGSGCRLVEYDSAGRVVGEGQTIKLSENTLFSAPKLVATSAPEPQLAEPAIWSAPLVRTAGVTLADAVLGVRADRDAGPAPPAQAAVDPQAAFVALAEQAGSYAVAAREHPEAWAAYRDAADLNGVV